jgi:hypothetical protein
MRADSSRRASVDQGHRRRVGDGPRWLLGGHLRKGATARIGGRPCCQGW